jgi:outer membrane protein OmpA-like peptidoglycan-associated protein
MKKIFLCVAIIAILPLLITAQSVKKAQKAMDRYDFTSAIIILKKTIENGKNLNVTIPMLAECYRMQHDIFNTRAWYSRAVTLPDAKPVTFLYYAKALEATGDYKAAREFFLKYDSLASDKKGLFFAANCDSVLGSWKNIKPVYEIKSVDKINTDKSEFGPVFYKGSLIFSSDYNYGTGKGKTYGWTGRGYLDIVKASPTAPGEYWNDMQKPSLFDNKLNQTYHDGPCTFNKNGDTIFFTRSYKDKAKKENGFKTNMLKLFYATRTEGSGWSEPKSFFLNSTDYSVGHPALSPDGKTLYFASNMPGGFGGIDLWMVSREAGSWSKPTNLGNAINTSEDEMFPFINDDGSLFFASNGHPGYGAMDIFCSRKTATGWSSPVNFHPPINSSFDDFAMAFAPGCKIGFFSSNRPGGKGNDDIYAFKEKEPEAIVVLAPRFIQGHVKDKSTLLPIAGATVFILNPVTNKVKVLKTDANGLYQTSVETNDTLIVKAMKNEYIGDCLSWPFDLINPGIVLDAPRDLLLDKLVVNKIFTIENIYYDFDKYNIRADAKPELDKLIRIMKENAIKVELGSHTDCRGSFKYNERLAENRAKSAVDYLTSGGIEPDRLIAKGYGEYKLVNNCSDDVPCTEAEHQANRRTEFKVLDYVDVTAQKDFFDPDLLKEGEVIDLYLLPSGFFRECLMRKPLSSGETPGATK